jgi:hypothetical protein
MIDRIDAGNGVETRVIERKPLGRVAL